jgi:hypothetical protein
MNHMAPQGMLKAFDDALEVSSRRPRLLKALGLQSATVNSRLLNDALQRRGFGRILEEDEMLDTSDGWWPAIAERVTGRRDASINEVVAEIDAAKEK